MEKFPKEYKKPQLLDVTKAAITGWTADCPGGYAPSTPACNPGAGPVFSESDDSFIPPEVLQQGL